MMKKIHTLHIIHSLALGGMEKIIVSLIKGLAKDTFTSSLCCLEGLGPLIHEIDQNEVKVYNFQKGGTHDPWMFLKLARLFRKEKPQIVHTSGWAALFDGIIGARLAQVPVVIHSEHGRSYEDLYYIPKRRIWTQRIVLPYLADKVCVVCEHLKEFYMDSIGLKEPRMVTIHNGIELKRFEITVNVLKKRQEIGCREDDLVIGTVGRLDPVKDFSTFLNAAAIVSRFCPKAKFLFVGDGPSSSQLKELTRSLDLGERVIFLGVRDDVPELLKTMDIFALSSLSEGLSKAVLEAMAAGLPVVATDVGGNPELIVHGQTGVLVPPEDPNKLAQAIISLLKNPQQAKEMGNAGQKRVQQYFSLERMITSYQQLYLDLVRAKIQYG